MQNIAGSVRPTPWAEACCPLYWNKIRISVWHGPARPDQRRLLASLRVQESVAPQSAARSEDGASSPRPHRTKAHLCRLRRQRISVESSPRNHQKWWSSPMTFRRAELLPAAVRQRNCQSQLCWWLCCVRWTGGGTSPTHTSRRLCTCMTLIFDDFLVVVSFLWLRARIRCAIRFDRDRSNLANAFVSCATGASVCCELRAHSRSRALY